MCTVNADTVECDSDNCLRSVAGLARLRRSVRTLLSPVGQPQLDDAVLVVDTLATHALHHGEPPVRLRIQIRDQHRTLWIEIYDAATTPPHTSAPVDQHTTRLLNTICTHWGVIPARPGRTVWAELALT